MAKLSVIVPVYNVEPFVRECLESIVSQPFRDLEVIVVDDASTDNSRHILAEYAEREPNVTLIALDSNGGLGNARNVGLDAARGDYVLFVDSDDWLAPNSLAAIAERLDATTPDVLVFDYARSFWRGTTRRNARSELLTAPGPDVFSLRERPEMLDLLMVVWNKAYRREFLDRLGLRFYSGFYEDLPWTYPVMMAAERITLLPDVCYFYRQRRHGNILRTSSRKHFDVFDQYERVFAFVDAHPELDDWRPVLHRRMSQHILAILGKGEQRVPPALRREFFLEAHRRYRGLAAPGGLPAAQGLELNLLRRNAYGVFRAVESWRETQHGVLSRAARLRKRYRPRVRRGRAKSLHAAYRYFRRLPIDDNLAVFAAYWYRGYSCNPRAIYEKMRELAPGIRGVWVVSRENSDTMPAGVEHVVEGTLAYYRLLATAKYFVNNVNFPNDVVKRPGTVHVQTQHGTPLKTMGLDLQRYPLPAQTLNFAKLLRRSDRWDYNLSSNRFSTEVWGRSFPCNYTTLEYGYPRNDIFYSHTPDDVRAVRDELGIPDGRTAVLYAPTFRDYQQTFEPTLDLGAFSAALGDSYVVLVRAHYYYEADATLRALQARGAVVDVSAHPDVERLCLAADILLTDYSSIMFDYANLDRPIVIHAPDWELYTRLRGVNFDLMADPPGPVARDQATLEAIFRERRWDSDAALDQRSRFRRRFCEFDDGSAAERVVRRVFLRETVSPPAPLSRGEHAGARSGLVTDQVG